MNPTTAPEIGAWYRSTIDPAVQGQVTGYTATMVTVAVSYGGTDVATLAEFADSWQPAPPALTPQVLGQLRAIMSADPDGGQTEPTEAAYAAHRAWAIEAFGPAIWALYTAGGWDDPSDDPRHVEY